MSDFFIYAFCAFNDPMPTDQLALNKRVESVGVEEAAIRFFSCLTGDQDITNDDRASFHRSYELLTKRKFITRRLAHVPNLDETLNGQLPRPWLQTLYLTRQALLHPAIMNEKRRQGLIQTMTRDNPEELTKKLKEKL